MKRLSMALAVALLMLVHPLGAQDGAAEARMTIERQLGAFTSNDGDTAYSLAAPNIRRLFPTVDGFMAMVRNAYEPVYRARDITFGTFEARPDGQIAQRVMMQGPDGRYYEALYTLERQPDGIWRITGVSLNESGALGA
jgi:hypothetical protein